MKFMKPIDRLPVVFQREGAVDLEIVLGPETVGDDDEDGKEEQRQRIEECRRYHGEAAGLFAARPGAAFGRGGRVGHPLERRRRHRAELPPRQLS